MLFPEVMAKKETPRESGAEQRERKECLRQKGKEKSGKVRSNGL